LTGSREPVVAPDSVTIVTRLGYRASASGIGSIRRSRSSTPVTAQDS
jgi:hypothetical protein